MKEVSRELKFELGQLYEIVLFEVQNRFDDLVKSYVALQNYKKRRMNVDQIVTEMNNLQKKYNKLVSLLGSPKEMRNFSQGDLTKDKIHSLGEKVSSLADRIEYFKKRIKAELKLYCTRVFPPLNAPPQVWEVGKIYEC